jgi:Barrel-sandwich domain of CusB or HlyD membrane-fusion
LFSPELVQKAGYFRGTTGNPQFAPVGLTMPKESSNPYSRELSAPQAGVVIERNGYVGQYVPEGEKLFTIVDASVLWFRFDVYDRQLAWLEPGQTVEVTVPALPGRVFPAVISFIEPTLNEATRTIRVRADVKNPIIAGNSRPHRLLRFGMYAEGRVRAETAEVLVIPRTAVLFPGGAAYAYLDRGNGAYERRQVKLGRQGDELWEVMGGLEEGDSVVTPGNVLLDAQAEFNRGAEPEMTPAVEMTVVEPASPMSSDAGPMDHSSSAGVSLMAMASEEPQAVPHAGKAPMPPAVSGTPVMDNAETNAMASAALAHMAQHDESGQPSTNPPLTRAAVSVARMAFKEEMWRNRMALIAAAHEQAMTNGTVPSTQTSNVVRLYLAQDGARFLDVWLHLHHSHPRGEHRQLLCPHPRVGAAQWLG